VTSSHPDLLGVVEMQFKQRGPWLFAFGVVALCIDGLVSSLEPGEMPDLALIWPPLCAMIIALCLLFRRTRAVAGGILALFGLVALVQEIPDLAEWPPGLSDWVFAAEMLTFAALGLGFVRPEVERVVRVLFGLAVVVFGAAHAFYPGVHAGYLPDGFPVPGFWPYLTGLIQIVAGAMIMIGFRASAAAFAVGLMWLSWIPIVLLSPALGDIGDPYQRYLMLTLLALAGAAWSIGDQTAAQPGADLRSRTR
jgi:hypothetical protein